MTIDDKYSASAAGLFLSAIIALFAITGCWPQDPAFEPAASPTLSACPTEDAPGPCRWDATVQGNGAGQSFTVTTEPDGTTVYTYDDGSQAGLIPPAETP